MGQAEPPPGAAEGDLGFRRPGLAALWSKACVPLKLHASLASCLVPGAGKLVSSLGRRRADETEPEPVRWRDKRTGCRDTLTPGPDTCPLSSLGHVPCPLRPSIHF